MFIYNHLYHSISLLVTSDDQDNGDDDIYEDTGDDIEMEGEEDGEEVPRERGAVSLKVMKNGVEVSVCICV